MIPNALRRYAPRLPATTSWGVRLAFVTALISGVSIFVNGYAVKQLPDAAVYTTLKNGVAAVILVALAALLVRPADVRSIDRRSWLGLGVIGVVGGSIPFILFFTGLAQATAPTAAFIQKTLFIWVALLAVPFLGERLGWIQVAALGVLFAGQLLAAPPTGVRWGNGETMIAAATILWSVEVVIARRLLSRVPSPVLGAARLGIGLVVLVGFVIATGKAGIVTSLTATQAAWGVGTGLLLAGYVATWFAALRRAPATVVTSVLVVGAPITAILQAVATGKVPAPSAVGGLVLITIGAAVLVTVAANARRWSAEAARA